MQWLPTKTLEIGLGRCWWDGQVAAWPLPVISRVYNSYNPGSPSVRPFLPFLGVEKLHFYNDRRVRQSFKKNMFL